jgi:hypothetical protein
VTDPCPDCAHRDAAPSPRHAPDCPRYAPPARGPGSTDEGRAQARRLWEDARVAARIRREIESAKRRAAGGTP